MKINKKLLVNLICTITGVYFGYCITDIYYTRKQTDILEENNSALDLSIKNLKAMNDLYEQTKQKYKDYKEYVNNVISDEELEKLTRDKYFTE